MLHKDEPEGLFPAISADACLRRRTANGRVQRAQKEQFRRCRVLSPTGTAKTEMSDTFDCEFEAVNAPYKLLRFCVSNTCYSNDEKDGERKRRFQEMQVLLQRPAKSD
jgi:hypothetical protein